MADRGTTTIRLEIDGSSAGGKQAVREMVDALKGLGATASTQGKVIAGAGQGLGTFAKDVKTQITNLGGALVGILGVKKFFDLGLAALDTAREIGHLSQETGIAVETLSVLGRVAKQNDLDLQSMAQGIRGLANRLQAVQQGNDAAVESFKILGFNAKEAAALAGGPFETALFKTINALDKLAEGQNKNALVGDLFGGRATKLIPIFNALANDGFAKARTEAELLGQVIREQDVRAAEALDRSLNSLKDQTQQLSSEFFRGLIPAAVQTVGVFHEITGAGQETRSGFRLMGEAVGGALKVLLIAFNIVATGLVAALQSANAIIGGIGRIGRAALRGNLAEVKSAFQQTVAEVKEFVGTGVQENVALVNKLFPSGETIDKAAAKTRDEAIAALQIVAAKVRAAGKEVEPFDISTMSTEAILAETKKLENALKQQIKFAAADRVAVAKAEAEARLAIIDREVALIRAHGENLEAAATASFDAGQTSLAEFFKGRRDVMEAGFAGEIAAAKARIAALAGDVARQDAIKPGSAEGIAARVALKNAENALEILGIQLVGKRAALTAEETAKRKELNRAEADFQIALQEAQGRTRDAALAGIEVQVTAFRESLTRLLGAGSDVEAFVQAFREAATVRVELDALEASSNALTNAITANRTRLDQAINAGAITADAATIAQNKFVADLRGAVDELIAKYEEQRVAAIAAHADPAILAGIDAQILGLRGIVEAASQAQTQLDAFGTSALQSLGAGIISFFNEAAEGAVTFGEAAVNALRSVIKALGELALKILVAQAITAAARAIGVPIPAGGFGFAQGGIVPGTGTGDTVHAMLTPKEYVLSHRMIAALGGLEELERLRHMVRSGGPVRRGHVTAYAGGGLVQQAQGSQDGGGPVRVIVELEDGMVGRMIEQGSATQQAILRTVRDNPSAAGITR